MNFEDINIDNDFANEISFDHIQDITIPKTQQIDHGDGIKICIMQNEPLSKSSDNISNKTLNNPLGATLNKSLSSALNKFKHEILGIESTDNDLSFCVKPTTNVYGYDNEDSDTSDDTNIDSEMDMYKKFVKYKQKYDKLKLGYIDQKNIKSQSTNQSTNQNANQNANQSKYTKFSEFDTSKITLGDTKSTINGSTISLKYNGNPLIFELPIMHSQMYSPNPNVSYSSGKTYISQACNPKFKYNDYDHNYESDEGSMEKVD